MWKRSGACLNSSAIFLLPTDLPGNQADKCRMKQASRRVARCGATALRIHKASGRIVPSLLCKGAFTAALYTVALCTVALCTVALCTVALCTVAPAFSPVRRTFSPPRIQEALGGLKVRYAAENSCTTAKVRSEEH